MTKRKGKRMSETTPEPVETDQPDQNVSDDDTTNVDGDAEQETTNVVHVDGDVNVTGQDNADDDPRDPRRDPSDYVDGENAAGS